MSEIKQEILDLLILNGRKPQTIKSGERVVYLYDALNIVNKEFSKIEQPQLNENQQGMLQEVIKQYDTLKPKTVLHALEHLSMIAFLLDEMDEVTEEDCIVVAQAFLDWAQEQGEE